MWPRCESQAAHSTSVRTMPWLVSASVLTLSSSAGALKLGQPHPESNFASELNSSLPQAAHLYVPLSFVKLYSPVNGRSVAFRRATAYCSGVSSRLHSSSVLVTFLLINPSPSKPGPSLAHA